MKKIITSCAFTGILIVFLMIFAALWQKERRQDEGNIPKSNDQSVAGAPAKMIEMGPVGSNITSRELVGDALITITASRMWIKKTRTFGFDNALLKRLAASDFRMTVSKEGEKILSVRKRLVEMPLDRKTFIIHKPKILYPAKMKQPDSIRVDKSKRLIIFTTGKSDDVWDLKAPIIMGAQ